MYTALFKTHNNKGVTDMKRMNKGKNTMLHKTQQNERQTRQQNNKKQIQNGDLLDKK